MFNSLSRDTRGRPYPLPGAPTLFDDECLSSWISRCALKYGFPTSRDFVLGLLALDRLTLEPGLYDWDSAPPLVVLQAIERRGGLPMAQLTQRLAPSGTSLRPGEKDAYCPECFKEDVMRGEVYLRTEWINPWIVSCRRHACPLGCYAARPLESNPKSAEHHLWQELKPVGRVYPVHAPAPLWLRSAEAVSKTLDLSQDWQRRLMLTLGLPVGKRLLYALTAQDDVVWLTDSAEAGDVHNIRGPRAKIGWRLKTARAVHMMGTMATSKTLAIQEPRAFVAALWEDLSQAQRWVVDPRRIVSVQAKQYFQ